MDFRLKTSRRVVSSRSLWRLAWSAASLALIVAFGAASADAALGLGMVTIVDPVLKCPAGAVKGAKCEKIQVTNCANVDDLMAMVAVAVPSGTATPIGTIVLHNGSGGTKFFTNPFANTYLRDGFRIVEIEWMTDWEQAGSDHPGSILAAACRTSTFINWAYSQFHHSDKSKAYCLQGHSGGSGALGYGLAQYGLSSIVDAAMFSAGPVFGDIFQGCTSNPLSTVQVCPGVSGIFSYSFPGSAQSVDGWEHTSTCENSPSMSDETVWENTSVDTTGAVYDYPNTVLSSFECPNYNGAPGIGTFFWDNVPASEISTIKCDTGCPSEAYWYTPTNLNTMVNQMLTDCIPRH